MPNGYIAMKINDKWGIINEKDNVIIEAKYDYISCINTSNGYGVYKYYLLDYLFAGKNGKRGLIDINDNVKIPFVFNSVNFNKRDSSFFCHGDNVGYRTFDFSKGSFKLKWKEFWNISLEGDSLFVLKSTKHHYGLALASGKMLIDTLYQNIGYFDDTSEIISNVIWSSDGGFTVYSYNLNYFNHSGITLPENLNIAGQW